MKAALVAEAESGASMRRHLSRRARENEYRVTMRAAALSQLTVRERSTISSSGLFPLIQELTVLGCWMMGDASIFLLPGTAARNDSRGWRSFRCLVASNCRRIWTLPLRYGINAGMSSWAALKERAKFVAGEVVLVNGATGIAVH